ncbi:MAG: tRNA (adenosine(37)-N6)-threonylcarbamoyltransferase complex dimerization subunit type 1 TsaB [Candidatus Omnitrophica bacterium]|nr:tRNA (adenosine(37)-N6)-threonylcarbamoyltransferase complex dimerization subunit type 1 TsaB [Candidatus Omnitrophota bacterium]
MYILSLETSTKNFSLAVSHDEKLLRFRNVRTDRILESSMLSSIDKLLSSCDLTFDQVDALAVGLGPGSFTSLRVGLSTVKAFGLATDKKIVGICSLDVLASAVSKQKVDEICVVVDARRGNVYAAIYNMDLSLKTEYLLTKIEDVLTRVKGKTLFVGDGATLYQKQIEEAYKAQGKISSCRAVFADEKFSYPQARELAKLALKRLEQKKYDDPATIVPIYLYPQDCQVDRR